jgi:poly(3-hydroxybutyrate) depolymerase
MAPFFVLAACIIAALCVIDAAANATPRSLVPGLGGCLKALPKGQKAGAVSNITISTGGLQRNYLIFIPSTYNSLFPTPIILSYHGGVRTAEDQLLLDELTNPEFNKEYFVVYPQGIGV